MIRCRKILSRLLASRRWWIVPILLFALAVRWPGMDKPLFHDEWRTVVTLPEAFQAGHLWQPQLWMAHLARALEGWGSAVVLRLPYLILGLIAIFLGWRLGRLWRDWPAGVMLAAALAVWPFAVYWHTMLREYSVLLCFGLATLVAWESYRVRPGALRCLLALALSGLTAYIHELAPIILIFPVAYLAWELCRLIYFAVRRRAPSRRRYLMLAGESVLTLGVLLVLVAQFTGIDVAASFAAKMSAAESVPAGATGFDVSDAATTTTLTAPPPPPAPAAQQARIPTAAEAREFVVRGVSTTLREKSLLPLMGIADAPKVLIELVAGPTDRMADFNIQGIHGVVLIGLLIGSLALARISPPLLVSLWFLVFANAIVVSFNRHLRPDPASRYFLLAGMAGLILLVAGVCALFGLARCPIRRRPRAMALVTMLAPLGLALAMMVLAARRDLEAGNFYSRHWLNPDTEGAYRLARDRFPHGAMVIGLNAENWQWVNRLNAHADRRNQADPWTSAARNRFLDITHHRWLIDFNLLERANPFAGLMIYQPQSVDAKRPLPFHRVTGLLPVQAVEVKANRFFVMPLGRRVFFTRGQSTAVLGPRLADEATSPGARQRVQLQAHYEIPGIYEYDLLAPGEAGAVRIVVDGQSHRTDNRPASIAWSDQDAAPIDEAAPPAPARDFADAAAQYPFIHWTDSATTATAWRRWTSRIVTPAFPMQGEGQPIEIETDPLPRERPMLLRMTYHDTWTSCTELFDAGTLQVHETADGFYFGIAMRARDVPTSSAQLHMLMEDMQSQQHVASASNPIYARRDLRPGDSFWLGWARLSRDVAAAAGEGRDFMLRVEVGRIDPQDSKIRVSDRHFDRSRGEFANAARFILCLVRFVPADGKLTMQFGLPEGNTLQIAQPYPVEE